MTVFFDPDRKRWRYDFQRAKQRYAAYCENPDGSACRNKTEAVKAEERAKNDAQKPTLSKPIGQPTLALAFASYLPTLPPIGDPFGDDRRAQVTELGDRLGLDTPLVEIQAKVPSYVAWARQQKVRIYVGGPKTKKKHKPARELWKTIDRLRSPSTINRYLDALRRAVGDYAALIDPATGQPRLAKAPVIEKLKETRRIPHPVPDGDLAEILATAAPWVVDAATLIRHMGFRKAEMLAAPIAQVDLEQRGIWLRGEATKGDRDEFVPANETAMAVLRRRKAEARLLGIKTLFWYTPPARKDAKKTPRPRPIKDFKGAWSRAMKRAGFGEREYRIHDLKASFVTSIARHAKAATVQKLARHKSFETTQRYLDVVDQDARDAVDAISTIRPSPTQKSHTRKRANG